MFLHMDRKCSSMHLAMTPVQLAGSKMTTENTAQPRLDYRPIGWRYSHAAKKTIGLSHRTSLWPPTSYTTKCAYSLPKGGRWNRGTGHRETWKRGARSNRSVRAQRGRVVVHGYLCWVGIRKRQMTSLVFATGWTSVDQERNRTC